MHINTSYNAIRIYPPTDLGIIIPTLQIVKSRLGIVVVATVTEGVVLCGGGGTAVYIRGGTIAPGVVGGARREQAPARAVRLGQHREPSPVLLLIFVII